jgi:hypothetical protein
VAIKRRLRPLATALPSRNSGLRTSAFGPKVAIAFRSLHAAKVPLADIELRGFLSLSIAFSIGRQQEHASLGVPLIACSVGRLAEAGGDPTSPRSPITYRLTGLSNEELLFIVLR